MNANVAAGNAPSLGGENPHVSTHPTKPGKPTGTRLGNQTVKAPANLTVPAVQLVRPPKPPADRAPRKSSIRRLMKTGNQDKDTELASDIVSTPVTQSRTLQHQLLRRIAPVVPEDFFCGSMDSMRSSEGPFFGNAEHRLPRKLKVRGPRVVETVVHMSVDGVDVSISAAAAAAAADGARFSFAGPSADSEPCLASPAVGQTPDTNVEVTPEVASVPVNAPESPSLAASQLPRAPSGASSAAPQRAPQRAPLSAPAPSSPEEPIETYFLAKRQEFETSCTFDEQQVEMCWTAEIEELSRLVKELYKRSGATAPLKLFLQFLDPVKVRKEARRRLEQARKHPAVQGAAVQGAAVQGAAVEEATDQAAPSAGKESQRENQLGNDTESHPDKVEVSGGTAADFDDTENLPRTVGEERYLSTPAFEARLSYNKLLCKCTETEEWPAMRDNTVQAIEVAGQVPVSHEPAAQVPEMDAKELDAPPVPVLSTSAEVSQAESEATTERDELLHVGDIEDMRVALTNMTAADRRRALEGLCERRVSRRGLRGGSNEVYIVEAMTEVYVALLVRESWKPAEHVKEEMNQRMPGMPGRLVTLNEKLQQAQNESEINLEEEYVDTQMPAPPNLQAPLLVPVVHAEALVQVAQTALNKRERQVYEQWKQHRQTIADRSRERLEQRRTALVQQQEELARSCIFLPLFWGADEAEESCASNLETVYRGTRDASLRLAAAVPWESEEAGCRRSSISPRQPQSRVRLSARCSASRLPAWSPPPMGAGLLPFRETPVPIMSGHLPTGRQMG